jgi:hypothetical protein
MKSEEPHKGRRDRAVNRGCSDRGAHASTTFVSAEPAAQLQAVADKGH